MRISLFRKKFWIGVVVILLLGAGFFLIEKKQTPFTEDYLAVSYGNPALNGNPIGLIGVSSGDIIYPKIPAIGCGGIAYDQKNAAIRLYCKDGADGVFLWDLGMGSGFTPLPAVVSYPMPHAVVHTRMQIDSDGTQYFAVGGPLKEQTTLIANDAAVMIVEGGSVSAVPISDPYRRLFILKVVLDERLDKLWVMSMGDEETVLIDRVDLIEKKIDKSIKINSYSGYDMIVYGNAIYTSVYRTSEKKDIFVIDAEAGEIKHSIELPVNFDHGYNALALIENMGHILISATGGIFEFDPETQETKRFIEYEPETLFTAFVGNESSIYAIDNYESVIELSRETLTKKRILYEGKGEGLDGVHYLNAHEDIVDP